METLHLFANFFHLLEAVCAGFLLFLFPTLHRASNRNRYRGAKDWRNVTATVLFTYMAQDPHNGKMCVTLWYNYPSDVYVCDGEYMRLFDREEDACHFERLMQKRQIPARYNPRNRTSSALNDDEIQRIVDQAAQEQQLSAPA